MGQITAGARGGKEIASVPIKEKEQCEGCPLKTGITRINEKDIENMVQRLCELEIAHASRPRECDRVISTRVSYRVFWPLILLLVSIGGGIFSYLVMARSNYEIAHNGVHKELTTEIKEMNRDLGKEIRTISEDIKVIKTTLGKE